SQFHVWTFFPAWCSRYLRCWRLPRQRCVARQLYRCCDRQNGFQLRRFSTTLVVVGGRYMANYSQSESTISHVKDSAASKGADQLDSAGEAILKLLHKAAGAAEANSRQALESAQRLSSQLRDAEDRIADQEAEVQHNREKSERAEEWLSKISTEIED